MEAKSSFHTIYNLIDTICYVFSSLKEHHLGQHMRFWYLSHRPVYSNTQTHKHFRRLHTQRSDADENWEPNLLRQHGVCPFVGYEQTVQTRSESTERGVWSGSPLFAYSMFNQILI